MSFDHNAAYPGLHFDLRAHGILWMTINRPDRMNATDAELHRGLSRVWLDIDEDPDVRVVVVTGAGDAFSAGGDLDWIASMAGDYQTVKGVLKEAGDIVYRMMQCEKIVISAINGVAVGAGLAVALMADSLGNLPFAIGLSRATNRIIRQNLWISLGMVAVLVPATILGLRIGPAVVLHEGSTIVVVLNALRLLAFKKTET